MEATPFIEQGLLRQEIHMNEANPLSPKIPNGLCPQRSPNALFLPLWMNHHIQQDALVVPITQKRAPGHESSLLIEASHRCPVAIPSVLYLALEGLPADSSS
jgi:hypothetical protein